MKIRKLISLVVCSALVFATACSAKPESGSSSGSKTETTKGRYVEKNVTPEGLSTEEPLEFQQLSDGKLVSYDSGLKNKYESTDNGETWTKSPGPGASGDRFAGSSFSIGSDGSLFIGLKKPIEQDGKKYRFLKINASGEEAPFNIGEIEDAEKRGLTPMISKMTTAGTDRLLVDAYMDDGKMMTGNGDGQTEQGSADEATNDDQAQQSQSSTEESPVSTATEKSAEENSQPTDASAPNAESGDESGEESGGMTFSSGNMVKVLFDTDALKTVLDLSGKMSISETSRGDKIYSMDIERNINIMNALDGKDLGTIKPNINTSEMVFNLPIAVDAEENIYIATAKEVYKIKKDGSSEKLFDTSEFTVGNPANLIWKMAMLDDGGLLFSVVNNSGGPAKLIKISYDESPEQAPTKTLKVWSLKDSSLVRSAISEFKASNPDIKVDYETGIADSNDEAGIADALQSLNTKLIAGEGPDIIFLDGCPIESYIDKGMLADLSKHIDAGNVFPNLLSSFKNDKGLFAVPLRFASPVIGGSKDEVSKIKTREDFMKAVESGNPIPPFNPETQFDSIAKDQRPNFMFNSIKEVFDLLWDTDAPEIIKDGRINQDNLRKMLQDLKKISDHYKLPEIKEEDLGVMMMSSGGGSGSTLSGSLMAFGSQRANYAALTFSDIAFLQFLTASVKDLDFSSLPGMTKGAWTPMNIAAISEDSENKEDAGKFINLLLSDTIQSLRLSEGLPVTKAGLDKQVEDVAKMIKESSGEDFDINLESLVNEFETPVITDGVLKKAFFKNADAYCRGTMDLEGAVSGIEQELKNYLAERK